MRSAFVVFGVFGVLSTLAAGTAPIHAQAAPAVTQFGLGAGTSTGGQYADRFEFTLDALLARRLHPMRATGRGLLAGLAMSGAFGPPTGDVCLILPGGQCAPTMPRYTGVAMLGGIEARGAGGTIDVLVGPALFLFVPPTRVGGELRIDLAAPISGHVGLVLSPRLLVIPHVANATLTLRSLHVGVRVW